MTYQRNKILEITLCGLFAAIMAVCSWITIPATVVTSFTLQTFGVFLTVGFLGGKRGTAAVTAYVLLGAAGLPVFAGMNGGLGAIFGNDGGFIVGFVFAALTMWLVLSRFKNKTSLQALIVSMIAGLLTCYAFGTAWFLVAYARNVGAVGVGTVLGWCVIPFLLPDAVKIVCAAALVHKTRKLVKLPWDN